MGLLSGLLGLVTEVDGEALEKELSAILAPGEEFQKAYRLVRDLMIFTDRRLILVNKQGMTGKKAEWLTIPYRSISRFSKETAGHFDLDAELRIWIQGESQPIVQEFRKDSNIHEVYQVLSTWVLARKSA
jgi:hypothetical protein